MWVTKLLISPVKKRDLLPKNDQIWPKIGIYGQFGPGHAGIFGALLVGQLVVEARGVYLARHLFTLSYSYKKSFSFGVELCSIIPCLYLTLNSISLVSINL